MTLRRRLSAAALTGLVWIAAPLSAQQMDHAQDHHAHGHQHPPATGHAAAGQEAAGHQHAQGPAMRGQFGPYGMTREASGTSWQPDSAPHPPARHLAAGDWMLMAHATLTAIHDRQGGKRSPITLQDFFGGSRPAAQTAPALAEDDFPSVPAAHVVPSSNRGGGIKNFVAGMAGLMAQRKVGMGTLGLRAMVTPEPLMGKRGYPLLLATGETADGRTPLVDRQHPHDLFMELSGSYSIDLSETRSLFLYAGLPGEPALGPGAFMHRASGMVNPEAPITHHWLDSTHITFGVVTLGIVQDAVKAEISAFTGREPDQRRANIERPRMDSVAARFTWNPTEDLSLQASAGHLHSPEQLAPDINERRVSLSATYNRPFGRGHNWATTFAWGRKIGRPGRVLDGFLLESALSLAGRHTIFTRAERVAHELAQNIALTGRPENMGKLSLGYVRDLSVARHWTLGAGALVSRYALPSVLKQALRGSPTSVMLFVRATLS
jgi:hypothetical protein